MTTIFPAKPENKGYLSNFTGFIDEVILAIQNEDGQETDFRLSLWKDEGKEPVLVLSGYNKKEYNYAGIDLTPDQIDEFCAQLQKAKDILLRKLDP